MTISAKLAASVLLMSGAVLVRPPVTASAPRCTQEEFLARCLAASCDEDQFCRNVGADYVPFGPACGFDENNCFTTMLYAEGPDGRQIRCANGTRYIYLNEND